ncbi:uncharacterized protein LOC129571735 [Sitodiplosis mosellana]|uniref:uncharacterized protein LOC129571735 n=1 Tax=Sitodiplosis mosellana TaxID=263140 RepID=UPI0024442400|nr:uncharacterized protein LOC129571735 [Sitodiplosis mosellana]
MTIRQNTGIEYVSSVFSEAENYSKKSMIENDSSLARIFNLSVDCFEEVFEWLSLTDLKTLRQTCKRFKTIVDYCLKTNYPALRIGHGIVEIFDWTKLQHIDCNCIKEIHFSNRCEYLEDFTEIKGILSQVENVTVRKDQICDEFYSTFLKFCKNLKYLSISNIHDHTIIGNDNGWLLQRYPILEHIILIEDYLEFRQPTIELKTFFELNPNVQTFTTTIQFLRRNGDCLKEINAKLDQLNVFCNKPFGQLVNSLLNDLNQRHFYKRLHLYGSYSTIVTDDLTSVCSLEKLNYARIDRLTLPPLHDLKEFSIGKVEKNANLISLAKSLTNVQRIYIEEATLKDIAAFICHTPNVKHIKVNRLNGGFIFNIRIIELAEVNEGRKKLTGASKIIVYVSDEFFLFMKWSGLRYSFSLIEFRRVSSHEWKNFCWNHLG